MKTLRRLLLTLFIPLAGAGIVVLGYALWSAHQPVNPTPRFVIEPGDGVSVVAGKLVQQKIIPNSFAFVFWSYQRGSTGSIKAGEYRIDERVSLIRLLEKFVKGDVITYSITFVEGWTFEQYLDQLKHHPRLLHTIENKTEVEIMSELGHEQLHPEGRFFPDTYVFSASTTDIEILRQALTRMNDVLLDAWTHKNEGLILKSTDEALILASIIEKETGKPEEREMIAGVFHNRLQKNMRLQTDPTVIYGLGSDFDGNLTRAHLKADTPYNTYTRAGLPPTPIANPGAHSIRAAVNPAQTSALYFVSRGDGSHAFSDTLQEHNAAVDHYQLGGKKKASAAGTNE